MCKKNKSMGSIVEQIKKASLTEWCEINGISLVKKGSSFFISSPFASDTTPSCQVFNDGFKCYSTGQSGSIIDLFMAVKNVDINTAISQLAQEFGLKTEKGKREYKGINAYFVEELLEKKERHEFMSYLNNRGIDMNDINNWGIGCGSVRFPKEMNPSLEGMGVVNDRGGCRFYNRITIPHIQEGKTLFWNGRVICDGGGEKTAKYIVSAGAKKDLSLFGWDKAKEAISQKGIAYIVEGEFDCIMCHKYGIHNTVAIGTNNISQHQAEMLASITDEVCFWLDNKGVSALNWQHNLKVCYGVGLSVTVQYCPKEKGKDPDEFLRGGGSLSECEMVTDILSLTNDSKKPFDVDTTFTSPKTIFALKKVRKMAKEQGFLVVCNGVTDALSLIGSGQPAVAVGNAAVSSAQTEIIASISTIVHYWVDTPFIDDSLKRGIALGLDCYIVDENAPTAFIRDGGRYAHAEKIELIKYLLNKYEIMVDDQSISIVDQERRRKKLFNFISLAPNELMMAYCRYLQKACKGKNGYRPAEMKPLQKRTFLSPDGTLEEKSKSNGSASSDKKLSRFKRIGTKFYNEVAVDRSIGNVSMCDYRYEIWDRQTIVDDYGAASISEIEKFHGFINQPCFFEAYKKKIEVGHTTWFNQFRDLSYTPSQGVFANIKAYLDRLFVGDLDTPVVGNPLHIFLDCLRLRFLQPKQKLPVLCLLSREQGTGKSTLLFLLARIFGDNTAILQQTDFECQFNSTWAGSYVVGMDEVKFTEHRLQVKNYIKNLVSSKETIVNTKGVKQYSITNYTWLLLTSNEQKLMPMEDEDTRFWVHEVSPIPPDQKVSDILELMQAEVPAFVHWVLSSPILHKKEDRFWFSQNLLRTAAFNRMVETTKPFIHREVDRVIKAAFTSSYDPHTVANIYGFRMTANDIAKLINADNPKNAVTSHQVSDYLRDNRGLKASPNTTGKYPQGTVFTDSLGEVNVGRVWLPTNGSTFLLVWEDWLSPSDFKGGDAEFKSYFSREAADLSGINKADKKAFDAMFPIEENTLPDF